MAHDGMVGIAVQSALQHAVLIEDTMKQEWQYHDGKECRCKPGAQRDAPRAHNQEAGASIAQAYPPATSASPEAWSPVQHGVGPVQTATIQTGDRPVEQQSDEDHS